MGMSEAGRGRNVLLTAAAMFLAIIALRFVVDSATGAVTLLFVIPVALVAVEFGVGAGLVAATAGFAAFAIWVAATDEDLGAVAYATRGVALGGIAVLVGRVSDRLRAAHEQLAESERSFRAVADTALEAIVTADDRGRILYLNLAAERMFGYSATEAAGRPITLLMPERFHDAHRAGFERFMATGEPHVIGKTVELEGLRSDGSEFPVSLSLSSWTVRGRTYFTGMIADITERRRLADAVEEERVRLAEAQRIAHVGSWHRDLRTGAVAWSAQNFRNHGLEPADEAPSDRELLELIHADDRDAVAELFASAATEPGEFVTGYRVVHPDGSIRFIELRGAALDGGSALAGTSRDVTAEREAERLKDEFFSMISHELRTPLTSIIGYAELIRELEGERMSEQGRSFLDVVERNSRRELSLVGDLLMLTRIEAGTFRVELGHAELDGIAAAAIEAARPAATAAGVEIAADLAEVPAIAGDPERLGQVADNLVSNAIKFSEHGGQVSVSVRQAGDALVLEVADQGMGIPASEVPRLFDRMFRARRAEELHIKGTGLGLAIVKAIVEAHGGEIGVESAVGEGTTFAVTIPARDPAMGEQVATPSPGGVARPGAAPR